MGDDEVRRPLWQRLLAFVACLAVVCVFAWYVSIPAWQWLLQVR